MSHTHADTKRNNLFAATFSMSRMACQLQRVAGKCPQIAVLLVIYGYLCIFGYYFIVFLYHLCILPGAFHMPRPGRAAESHPASTCRGPSQGMEHGVTGTGDVVMSCCPPEQAGSQLINRRGFAEIVQSSIRTARIFGSQKQAHYIHSASSFGWTTGLQDMHAFSWDLKTQPIVDISSRYKVIFLCFLLFLSTFFALVNLIL